MQSIAETCVRFDAAHLSINLVSEIDRGTHVSYLNRINMQKQLACTDSINHAVNL